MPSDPEDSTENPLADSPPKDEAEDFEPEPEPDPEQVAMEALVQDLHWTCIGQFQGCHSWNQEMSPDIMWNPH